MLGRIGKVVSFGYLLSAVLERYGITAEDVANVLLPDELDALCEECKTGSELGLGHLRLKLARTISRVRENKAEWPAFHRWMSANTWRSNKRNRRDFHIVMESLNGLSQQIREQQQPLLF